MSIDRFARIVSLRFRSLFRRDEVEQELDEELQDHIERQTAENVRLGMAPPAARTAALHALGNIAYRKEEVRDTRGMRWIEDLLSDMRFAFRSLRRSRGFSIAVVLTLALGIGANTAMFTLLRGTVLRPLPNRDGDRLVYLRQAARAVGTKNALFSVPEVNDFRAAASLSAVAEYSSVLPFSLVGKDGRTVRLRTAVVTGNYFDVLGLRPVFGRLTTTKDDGADAAPVAILSYEYWMEKFGGDRNVIGTTVRLNDRLTPIVGVLEPAPKYPHADDIYVNMVTSPHHLSATMVTERTHRMSELFARLAPDRDGGSGSHRAHEDCPEHVRRSSRGVRESRAVGRDRLAAARRHERTVVVDVLAPHGRRRVRAHHRMRQRREPDADARCEPRA
jgi:hypothetical protein